MAGVWMVAGCLGGSEVGGGTLWTEWWYVR